MVRADTLLRGQFPSWQTITCLYLEQIMVRSFDKTNRLHPSMVTKQGFNEYRQVGRGVGNEILERGGAMYTAKPRINSELNSI